MRRERVAALLPEAKLSTLPTALDAYGRTLARIVEAVRSHGAEPVFMTQVLQRSFASDAERERLWMGAVNGGESYVAAEQYPVFLELFNDRMREVARARGVALLDLGAAREWTGDLFYDGMHFNEAGARAVARIVADFFVQNGMLRRRRD